MNKKTSSEATETPTVDVCHVLLVDDEKHFRAGIRRLIRILHHTPPIHLHEASNGNQAMDVLAEETMDCILLDYKMPGLDGIECLKHIMEYDKNLSVVMVTGHGDEETAVRAMKSGAMDYLVKGSITPTSLERAITNATEKARMKQELSAQREKLLDAERQRVMIQSLGAACHHLGQPATSIACHLALMKKVNPPKQVRELIDKCSESLDALVSILQQLQRISAFRTTPYLVKSNGPARPDELILDIESVS